MRRGSGGRWRFGMAVAIALAVLLVLGVMALAVHQLRVHSYRALGWVDGYLRAVSTGEACYTRIVSQIQSKPWEERWFKGGQKAGDGSWERNTYEFILSDGPRENEAELVVCATAGDVNVSMYWRLRANPATLSPYRQVRAAYYTFLDPNDTVKPGNLGGLTASIDQSIKTRQDNLPWEQTVRGSLIAPGNPSDPFAGLGIPGEGALVDAIPATDGSGTLTSIGARLLTPRPSPTASLPSPQPGEASASPDTLGQLSRVRTELDTAASCVAKVRAAYTQALVNSLATVTANLAAACPRHDPSVQACQCLSAVQALQAEITAFDQTITDCQNKIQQASSAIDQASGSTSLTASEADQLMAQATEAKACPASLVTAANSLASRVQSAIVPCGQTILTQGATARGTVDVAIATTGDLTISGPDGTVEVSCTGVFDVRGAWGSLHVTNTGDVTIDEPGGGVTISVTGKVSVAGDWKVTSGSGLDATVSKSGETFVKTGTDFEYSGPVGTFRRTGTDFTITGQYGTISRRGVDLTYDGPGGTIKKAGASAEVGSTWTTKKVSVTGAVTCSGPAATAAGSSGSLVECGS